MKLYMSPGASSLAAHIALLEGGFDFTAIRVDFKAKTIEGGGDYRAVTPKGYIPALVLEDGSVLTENVAVLGYIAERAGQLASGDALLRWRLVEMLAFVATELHKSYSPLFTPGASDDAKQAAAKHLTGRFALLEPQLAGQDFILGDSMTTADCYLFAVLFWARNFVKLDLPPNLSAYLDRLMARPAVLKALQAEGLGG